jgi:hypothetical protein
VLTYNSRFFRVADGLDMTGFRNSMNRPFINVTARLDIQEDSLHHLRSSMQRMQLCTQAPYLPA